MRATDRESEYGCDAEDLVEPEKITDGDHPDTVRGVVGPRVSLRKAFRVGINPDGTTFIY